MNLYKWVVIMMDQYRDARLFWHAVDFLVIIGVVIALVVIFKKLRRIKQEAEIRQEELASLVQDITKTAKTTNRVYRKIHAAEVKKGGEPTKFISSVGNI